VSNFVVKPSLIRCIYYCLISTVAISHFKKCVCRKITGTPIDLNTENTGNLETKIIAGQLNVPDQSCRTVSHILSNMTSIYSQKPSLVSQKVLNLLNNTMCMRSELDSGFLKGSIVEVSLFISLSNFLLFYLFSLCLVTHICYFSI